MDWIPAIVGALLGAAAGPALVANQWRLYREAEYRQERLAGRRLRIYSASMALVLAITILLSLRPDHYDYGPALVTAGWCIVLVLVSSTDFERRRIPNKVTYPAIAVAAALCWVWPDRSIADVWIGFGIALGAGTLLFLLGQLTAVLMGVRVTPFGMGDVKLIVLMGLLAGWPGIATVLFVGIVLAGIPSIVKILGGQSKSVFSYGPYLAGGMVAGLLFPDRFL